MIDFTTKHFSDKSDKSEKKLFKEEAIKYFNPISYSVNGL